MAAYHFTSGHASFTTDESLDDAFYAQVGDENYASLEDTYRSEIPSDPRPCNAINYHHHHYHHHHHHTYLENVAHTRTVLSLSSHGQTDQFRTATPEVFNIVSPLASRASSPLEAAKSQKKGFFTRLLRFLRLGKKKHATTASHSPSLAPTHHDARSQSFNHSEQLNITTDPQLLEHSQRLAANPFATLSSPGPQISAKLVPPPAFPPNFTPRGRTPAPQDPHCPGLVLASFSHRTADPGAEYPAVTITPPTPYMGDVPATFGSVPYSSTRSA